MPLKKGTLVEQFYHLSLNIHIACIYIAMILAVCYIAIASIQDRQKALMLYWKFLPLYYFNISVIALMGSLIYMFISGWIYVILMVAIWVFMIVGSAKSYRLLKECFKGKGDAKATLRFVKRKYLVDLALMVLMMGYGYIR